MLRFLLLLCAFLFPFIIYALYIKLSGHFGKERPQYNNIIAKLIILGLVCCGLSLIALRFSAGDKIQSGTFVPSYEKNGEIIPSHFE